MTIGANNALTRAFGVNLIGQNLHAAVVTDPYVRQLMLGGCSEINFVFSLSKKT
jgi:hypothetical protein